MVTFLYFMLYLYILFLGFMVYVSASGGWSRLKIGIKILIAPVIIVFGAMDVCFNIIGGTILFLEIPTPLTFSERCSSHFYASGWRGEIARAFAVPLNAIDPYHIK